MRRALVTAALAGLVWPAVLAAADCRLALLLAMDVSSSVDEAEDRLQRSGLAAALIAPEVRAAFLSAGQPVALAVFEWSGRYNQKLLLDWRLIDDAADLTEAARAIAQSRRSHNDFPTAMGFALGYAAGLLDRGPVCLKKTIDVAGDGINNDGFAPHLAYAEFPFTGVTVNGLVVNESSLTPEIRLLDFYRMEVLRGPGAFLEVATGFDDYERAMRRKLERELGVQAIGGLNLPANDPPG